MLVVWYIMGIRDMLVVWYIYGNMGKQPYVVWYVLTVWYGENAVYGMVRLRYMVPWYDDVDAFYG